MSIVPLRTGGAVGGIIPQTIEEVFRIATAVAKSGLAPNGMNTAEKLTVAIMHGMEIGLQPMQAIQKISVVNGRPTVWGDAIPALLWSRGFSIKEWDDGEGDAAVAWCRVIRPDGNEIVRSFSIADAKVAGLWGKIGPWKTNPRRMRQMRARGFAARDGAADVLMGLYLREEVEDDEQIAPKSSSQAKKDGDFAKITSALAACTTEEDIDTVMSNMSETLDKVPRKWLDPINDHVEAARKRVTAVTIEPVADEPDDETASARQAIDTAISPDMLDHLRSVYPDADWESLAPEYDAKLEALQAVQP